MREYVISILGASVLSGIASLMAPEKHNKYIGIVSGLMILCTIVSPFKNIDFEELLICFDTPQAQREVEMGEEYRNNMIRDGVTERINSDIEERVKNEFGKEIKAYADVGVDQEGKITGVNRITVDRYVGERVRLRLREVYGVEEIIVGQIHED